MLSKYFLLVENFVVIANSFLLESLNIQMQLPGKFWNMFLTFQYFCMLILSRSNATILSSLIKNKRTAARFVRKANVFLYNGKFTIIFLAIFL